MSSGPKEISPNASKISILAPKSSGLEISPQGTLALGIEKDAEFGEIGMGVLSAAKRNGFIHKTEKGPLADHILDKSGHAAWHLDTHINARKLTVWNFSGS